MFQVWLSLISSLALFISLTWDLSFLESFNKGRSFHPLVWGEVYIFSITEDPKDFSSNQELAIKDTVDTENYLAMPDQLKVKSNYFVIDYRRTLNTDNREKDMTLLQSQAPESSHSANHMLDPLHIRHGLSKQASQTLLSQSCYYLEPPGQTNLSKEHCLLPRQRDENSHSLAALRSWPLYNIICHRILPPSRKLIPFLLCGSKTPSPSSLCGLVSFSFFSQLMVRS